LRRFGLALARDERFVLDDATAGRLVDKLIRQTCVAAVAEGFVSRLAGRARAFARFIQLYRRHVRRLAIDEGDGHWVEGSAARGGSAIVNGVRALPLELREALLLVALASFSHEEAARALDIPLARLLERLDRARARLAEQTAADFDGARESAWVGAPHLRVIK
jgi:RNA polymerase sigma-70 factor (ECF subfamily)